MTAKLSIAMIGTRGIPAEYGGFETALEEIGRRLASRGHSITVYCRDHSELPSFLGMRRVVLPSVQRRSLETLSHTALSSIHAVPRRFDAVFMFNAANALFSMGLRCTGTPVALHVDGLEWQRSKWGHFGRRWYLANEWLASKSVAELIADAPGISAYYRNTYGRETQNISYGMPRTSPDEVLLRKVGLESRRYFLVVARFEPENSLLEAVRGYEQSDKRLPLVVVGDAPYADKYKAAVMAVAGPNVTFLGSVWDQQLLDSLYAYSAAYIHGHTVGGTNPSLLRAAGLGAPVLARDVVFNRDVMGASAEYWSGSEDLSCQLHNQSVLGDVWRERARAAIPTLQSVYSWDAVADEYEKLAFKLASRKKPRRES